MALISAVLVKALYEMLHHFASFKLATFLGVWFQLFSLKEGLRNVKSTYRKAEENKVLISGLHAEHPKFYCFFPSRVAFCLEIVYLSILSCLCEPWFSV